MTLDKLRDWFRMFAFFSNQDGPLRLDFTREECESILRDLEKTNRTPDELAPPALLVLPSGRPFRLDMLFDFGEVADLFPDKRAPEGCAHIATFACGVGEGIQACCYDATDAAAIKSAILRYGVEANAPDIRKDHDAVE